MPLAMTASQVLSSHTDTAVYYDSETMSWPSLCRGQFATSYDSKTKYCLPLYTEQLTSSYHSKTVYSLSLYTEQVVFNYCSKSGTLLPHAHSTCCGSKIRNTQLAPSIIISSMNFFWLLIMRFIITVIVEVQHRRENFPLLV